jgi:hypothetical protein
MFLGKLQLPLADPSQAREDSRFLLRRKISIYQANAYEPAKDLRREFPAWPKANAKKAAVFACSAAGKGGRQPLLLLRLNFSSWYCPGEIHRCLYIM